MFRSVADYNFYNKKVLLRCDFNVPVKNNKVTEDFKMQNTLFTIKFLKKAGAKIIILTHFGSPQDIKNKRQRRKQYSLKPVHKKLQELLREKVGFVSAVTGFKAKIKLKKMRPGDILMLENLRFHKQEQQNSYKFAEKLASLGNVYVGEHFSVCHRKNASVAVLPKLMPRFIGFHLQKEIEMLSRVFDYPPRPLVVVVGGAKKASKMKIAQSLLKKSDFLLFGGEIANAILTAKGICPSKPWPKEDIVQLARYFNLTEPKIYLPVDVLASSDPKGEDLIRETAPAAVRKDEHIFDIGEETISIFSEIIKKAGAVFWAGPLGLWESKQFFRGTEAIASAIAECDAELKIVGGGETIAAVKQLNLENGFSFMSSGGGAMLAFLAREKMPGLEALKT